MIHARQDQYGDWAVFVTNSDGLTFYLVPPPLSKSKATELARRFTALTREATVKRANPGRHSRTKGHSFERWVAIQMRGLFPGARRHLENHKEDAASGTDVVGIGRYRVQCKKLKKYAPITCIEELKVERDLGEVPVLVTAGDRQEAMAILPFTDFLDLVKRSESN